MKEMLERNTMDARARAKQTRENGTGEIETRKLPAWNEATLAFLDDYCCSRKLVETKEHGKNPPFTLTDLQEAYFEGDRPEPPYERAWDHVLDAAIVRNWIGPAGTNHWVAK